MDHKWVQFVAYHVVLDRGYAEKEIKVGFYVSTFGNLGRTEFILRNGTVEANCGEPNEVKYAHVFLNKNLVDGTPGWFFESLIRHELGHVFGVCHAYGAGTLDEYKQSVEFAPDANTLAECRAHFPFNCASLPPTSTSADQARCAPFPPWTKTPSTPDVDPDFGSPNWPSTGVLAGTRCVFLW